MSFAGRNCRMNCHRHDRLGRNIDAVQAEVRLYERLFVEAHPEGGGKDFIENLYPNSLKVLKAFVEPSLAAAKADDKFQFERHGYFVADRVDHAAGKPVGEWFYVFQVRERW